MDVDILNAVAAKMKKYKIEARFDTGFDRLTTIGTGGKICIAIFPDSERKLVKTLRYLRKMGVDTVVLGRGSNVLAADGYFDGAVVVTVRANNFRIRGNTMTACCGASTAAMAKALAERGLSGGEFLSCLPGTAGGAAVSNAGCFGQDIKSIFCSAKALYGDKLIRLSAQECHFGKRDSIFKHKDIIVLSVKLKFTRSSRQAVLDAVAEMRRNKASAQPLNARSSGCVLYHDSVAVSRLIDEMGFKGYRVGGAEVSAKHAGFVLNIDKATSLDIYLIIRRLQQELWDRYGLIAKREVRLINFEDENDILSKREK